MSRRVLIWFHRDLRTHDHEGLSWALGQGCEVQAIAFAPSLTCSPAKLKFWNETVANLSLNLSSANIPLEISTKDPLEVLPKYFKEGRFETLITHRRMNFRDQLQLAKVASLFNDQVKILGDLTLFSSTHVEELTLKALKPFTRFKNHAMENWKVPTSLPRPFQISLPFDHQGEWSHGGESSGLARVHDYIWRSRACEHYHETRNGMITRDDSSKFSRWLSLGAVSVRFIFEELQKFQEENGPSEGATHLIYELVWRDYFKFLSAVIKDKLFWQQGLKDSPLDVSDHPKFLEAWRKGETNERFVDANMKELLLTGWMSNRGRQNVASYLAKTMNLNWVRGAEWFEQQLIDDDPESNWGNWQYLAGVGTDPRDRRFDVQRQAAMYDPEGKYCDLWIGRGER